MEYPVPDAKTAGRARSGSVVLESLYGSVDLDDGLSDRLRLLEEADVHRRDPPLFGLSRGGEVRTGGERHFELEECDQHAARSASHRRRSTATLKRCSRAAGVWCTALKPRTSANPSPNSRAMSLGE